MKKLPLKFISMLTTAMFLLCSCAPASDVVDYRDGLRQSDGVWYAATESGEDISSDFWDDGSDTQQAQTEIIDSDDGSAIEVVVPGGPASVNNGVSGTKTPSISTGGTKTPSKTTSTGGNSGGGTVVVTGYTPTYFSTNTKAVWISQWNLQDVFSKNKTKASFTTAVQAMFKKVKDYGFNTVMVQLRPYGDAFYPSNYYPWSYFVTGTVDKAPSFDPADIMVSAAHQYG
ncbi:MAG: family 10 glycosylhydrolase, partial [Oscillospiraceae bacterium]|nr:family 10 glycosylhydrolase [Candidatus Equicaccousia limihippi]